MGKVIVSKLFGMHDFEYELWHSIHSLVMGMSVSATLKTTADHLI